MSGSSAGVTLMAGGVLKGWTGLAREWVQLGPCAEGSMCGLSSKVVLGKSDFPHLRVKTEHFQCTRQKLVAF